MHRATGSGFSGVDDHGYRNNIVTYLGEFDTFLEMFELIEEWRLKKKPLFSCIGNMVPFAKKGQPVIEYLMSDGVRMVSQLNTWLQVLDTKPSIKMVTDYLNAYNHRQGVRKWNFPFSMTAADIATYHPDLVDQDSLLYCGCLLYTSPSPRDS